MNQDAKNKHDIEGGRWPQTMHPHTLKKRSKRFTKSFQTKHFHKSSYTIPKMPLKKNGEQAKAKINASWSKVTSILGWKSLIKVGISISTSEWRRQRIPMVSSNGVVGVFGTNARIVQAYSLTWIRAHAWHDHVNGGGVGSKINFKHLREAKVNALIVCFSCNVS